MHNCCKCGDWFHNHCLSQCDVIIPKRNHDLLCSKCKIPATIPWIHSNYVNTCTSDNLLTITLMYCSSSFCPSPITQRYQTSFGLRPAEISFSEQIQRSFRLCGDESGYCGQEFLSSPPHTAPYGTNGKLDLGTGNRIGICMHD